MLEKYYPYEYVPSVFAIDYEKLYAQGIRGLIFDLDNTLVHHGDPSTPEVDGLFARLHQLGFQTLILSDNSEVRILDFLKNIDSPYVAEAGKPDPAACRKSLEMLNLKADQAVVIGDQIFKDIVCANGAGIPSILVHYITVPGQKIGKTRYVEAALLKLFQNGRYDHRLGHIRLKKGEQA